MYNIYPIIILLDLFWGVFSNRLGTEYSECTWNVIFVTGGLLYTCIRNCYYLKGEMLFKPLIQSYLCKPVQSTKYKPPYANLSFNISSAQGSINVHHLKILFAGILFLSECSFTELFTILSVLVSFVPLCSFRL